jgi:hypothetical protein
MLAAQVSEIADEFDELTQAFIEARYSEHSISEEEASNVKKAWRQVKRLLGIRRRRRRRSSSGEGESA